jgi:hypothetical protein
MEKKKSFRIPFEFSPPNLFRAKFRSVGEPFETQRLNWDEAVKVPERIKLLDWIVVNIREFFYELKEYYALISAECTEDTCPTMKGVSEEFLWKHEHEDRQSKTAQMYITSVFSDIEMELKNEKVFPVSAQMKYQAGIFEKKCRKICREMARVCCHIVFCHKSGFVDKQLERSLGLSVHFLYQFVKAYSLVSKKTLAQLEHAVEASSDEAKLKIGDSVEAVFSGDEFFHEGHICDISEDDKYLIAFDHLRKQEWVPRNKIIISSKPT